MPPLGGKPTALGEDDDKRLGFIAFPLAQGLQKLFTPEDRRDEKVIASATRGLQRPLAVLDAALADRPYLLGEHFTVADLNVASVMMLMRRVGVGHAEHRHVQRWAEACRARPALARALARA